MGRSSSKLLPKPNNPLQELQFKESQRERSRKQVEKQRKQIARLQKKQAKKQRKLQKKKRGRNSCSSASGRLSQDKSGLGQHMIIKQRRSDDLSTAGIDMRGRYDFRREEFNRELEAKMQKDLNEDLCGFILNQSVLAMQFFKNYESELSTLADDFLAEEKELNQNLGEHSILLTNPLDVAVAKWINYKPLHGPDKHNPQLLQPQTIYMVFENIDIAQPNDANYDSISPLCKVDMELDFRETTPCKEDYLQMLNDIKWKGYVRLRLREDTTRPKSSSYDEEIYSEGSSGYGTTSPYGSKNTLNLLTSTPNTKDPEQDYDYAFITHLNTHHPLRELKMTHGRERQKVDAKVLPESCVSTLGNFVQPLQDEEFTDEEEDSESESDSDEDYGRNRGYRDFDTLQAIKLYRLELEKRRKQLAQSYLNSREFMKYFGELVRRQLALQLQIGHSELEAATFKGTSIYTSSYQLIPAIYVAQNVVEWPKCAFEFRLRDRPVSINPQTGQQIQWPTRAMIKRIVTFGFHVVPLGYAPKKKRNPFRDIEWCIVFPKAERYLEQHLTNGQIKVYMITKALLKSFVEPLEKNKSLMFALDHLRAHLFWECEKDYNAWPEEFLGDVLIRFLESFKQRVKEKRLCDFFIRDRNLFESIPEYSLNTLYTILADITANPLMHVMIAFRNLNFAEPYFPKLNFKKLFENLLENDMVKLKLLAKNARSLMDLTEGDEEEMCLMADEGAKGLVGMKQHHVKTNGKLRRKTHLLKHNLELKKQEMAAKRRSIESIDVEFFFTKNLNQPNQRLLNQGVENLRRTNILEILIDHLLDMSTKALEYRSIMVAKSCLSQARRLCKFYHNYGCDVGAKEYLGKIHIMDEELQILIISDDLSLFTAPMLPVRMSIEPISRSSNCSQAKETIAKLEPQPYNLYEEMVPQQEEVKKCLKFQMPGNCILEEEASKTLASRDHHVEEAAVHTVESKKSLKFLKVQETGLENESPSITCRDQLEDPLEKDSPSVLFRDRLEDPLRKDSPTVCFRDHLKDSLVKDTPKVCFRDHLETPTSTPPTHCPEPRKSIRFNNVVIKVQEGDSNPIVPFRDHLETPASTPPTLCAEPRKSIKFNNVVIKVQEGDSNPIQRPQGYSPISILRSKTEVYPNIEDSDREHEDEHEDNVNEESAIPMPTAPAPSKGSSMVPSFLKSSKDFLTSSTLGQTQIFQNISQNTNKFLSQTSVDEKKAQIRDMLLRKTVKLKGVFNQSSDT